MAARELWHYFFESVEDDKKTNIIKLLTDAGVKCSPYNSDQVYNTEVCVPGIIFFNESNQTLYNFLKEVSQQGVRRVLAVAVDSRLASQEIWNLLECGAEDAFTLCHPADFGND